MLANDCKFTWPLNFFKSLCMTCLSISMVTLCKTQHETNYLTIVWNKANWKKDWTGHLIVNEYIPVWMNHRGQQKGWPRSDSDTSVLYHIDKLVGLGLTKLPIGAPGGWGSGDRGTGQVLPYFTPNCCRNQRHQPVIRCSEGSSP